jgi:hypothetical protein
MVAKKIVDCIRALRLCEQHVAGDYTILWSSTVISRKQIKDGD